MRIVFFVDEDFGLESLMSGYFGRVRYFVFVDVEDGEIRGVEVVFVFFEEYGLGDLFNFIKEYGVEVVIVYGMGRWVMEYFN